ncbi:YybH family protein [Mycobacterium sp.]|uniref:YybH family protein n=1 Tax=Mycobacterium sp. TaxID=1785 RepID=UPI003BABD917
MSDDADLVRAVNEASERWKSAFNAGNAAECGAQYEHSATMKAEPFGTFEGIDKIQAFWQKLIDDGFSDVEYLDPQIEVVDQKSAVLTSSWKMNKAQGTIHRELWVIQEDGSAKLREDHFQAS